MDEQVTRTVGVASLAVSYELDQFCQRSTFDTFYEFTEAHLPVDERKQLAHQMIASIDAVASGLADDGSSPR